MGGATVLGKKASLGGSQTAHTHHHHTTEPAHKTEGIDKKTDTAGT